MTSVLWRSCSKKFKRRMRRYARGFYENNNKTRPILMTKAPAVIENDPNHWKNNTQHGSLSVLNVNVVDYEQRFPLVDPYKHTPISTVDKFDQQGQNVAPTFQHENYPMMNNDANYNHQIFPITMEHFEDQSILPLTHSAKRQERDISFTSQHGNWCEFPNTYRVGHNMPFTLRHDIVYPLNACEYRQEHNTQFIPQLENSSIEVDSEYFGDGHLAFPANWH
ncbi:18659_t:CDS:1 [Acaulospora morrowiae]|uniref:18659_t:CDS:1 n=1 Tax=Acaulospora morrowiae TaxID=94023 RepID=A0A9N9CXK3_9GLOM|nr:18659_t:CDS:1 [Acaulospora morrowiae]